MFSGDGTRGGGAVGPTRHSQAVRIKCDLYRLCTGTTLGLEKMTGIIQHRNFHLIPLSPSNQLKVAEKCGVYLSHSLQNCFCCRSCIYLKRQNK